MERVYDSSAVLRIALAAARPWGFALGGGRALLAHGVHQRPTLGIDLVTDREEGVRDGAAAVVEALSEAGYQTTEIEGETVIEGLDLAMVELAILTRAGVIPLSLGIQPRARPTVEMPEGPVVHLEDLAANKVAAMTDRADVRDFIDVAALQDRLGGERVGGVRLRRLAREVDPGLTDDDYAAAVRQLAAYSDELFEAYGAHGARVRQAFAAWPR
jgi:hypothetical protein